MEYRSFGLHPGYILRGDWCHRRAATGLDDAGDPECTACAEAAAGRRLDPVARLARLCVALGLAHSTRLAAERGVGIELFVLRVEALGLRRALLGRRIIKPRLAGRRPCTPAGAALGST